MITVVSTPPLVPILAWITVVAPAGASELHISLEADQRQHVVGIDLVLEFETERRHRRDRHLPCRDAVAVEQGTDIDRQAEMEERTVGRAEPAHPLEGCAKLASLRVYRSVRHY